MFDTWALYYTIISSKYYTVSSEAVGGEICDFMPVKEWAGNATVAWLRETTTAVVKACLHRVTSFLPGCYIMTMMKLGWN